MILSASYSSALFNTLSAFSLFNCLYTRHTSSYMCVGYIQSPESLTGIDLKKVTQLIGINAP
ncbi:hypothetical protein, partial [Yersinia pestis]|uniref:hypothetical protein n=1 Tax=Yersinia pestis TaxID=632 RepID=UPI001EE69FB4